jgi:hypothetical protein
MPWEGVEFTESMISQWKIPKWAAQFNEEEIESIRKKFHIQVSGERVPPPLTRFKVTTPMDMLVTIK